MAFVRVAKHYVNGPLFALGGVEAAVHFAAVYAAAHLRFIGSGGHIPTLVAQNVGDLAPRAFAYAAVMILAMFALGLYQARLREGFAGITVRTLVAMSLGFVALTVVFYVVPSLYFGRGVLLLATALSMVFVLLIRGSLWKLVDRRPFKRRILVLGAGDKAASINRFLRRKTDRYGFDIVAYLQPPDTRVAVDAGKDRVITIERPIPSYAAELGAREIVIAMDERRQTFPLDDLLDCKLENVDVIDLIAFFEREAGKVKLDQLSPSWLIYSDGFQGGAMRDISIRAFDIVVSLVLLLITWPFMLVTTLAILLECRGARPCPVLYRQKRVGLGGKAFDVIKFRSMRTDAEQDGRPRWASKDDDRVTRVGKIIRKIRVDELPQIFNVLKGDMSFVGPRPERPEFVEELSRKLPYYGERHRVKPGITGWAQLCYPYGSSDRDAMEKLQYDLYYVKNRTLFLNLIIVFQTAEVILFGKGAR